MSTNTIADTPDIHHRMAQFSRAHQRLLLDKAELIAQYPNRWVAVGEHGIIDTALTANELAEQLHAAGVPNYAVAAEFLTTEPKALII